MTLPSLPLGAASDIPLLLAIGLVVALAIALAPRLIRRRNGGEKKGLSTAAVRVAALAALGCTAYSADTSWRFAADYLDMATAERAGMFAAGELALFATALMARQNLASQGAPGLPGILVWVITSVQVIPAFAESGLIGGPVRAFVGPVMAAMLWHLAMGIELRLRTPGSASRGLIATLGREARERLLSRLGIATRDRDAAQITRDRAPARAVALAARLAERTPEQQRNGRGRRLTRRLSKAVGRASVGTDPLQRARLLDQLAARRHALALATIPLPSPWSPTHNSETAATTRHVPVPVVGPHGPAETIGDPGPSELRRPVPTLPAPDETTTTRAKDVGTEARSGTGSHGPGAGSGTGPTEDRGPADTGTAPTRDRGPADTGTAPTRDRGGKVPLRRKPTPATKGKGKRRSRSAQMPQSPREAEVSVDQLVEQVRPHVRALLDRDGNEAITRVQLREILRHEGLPGGRNERLSLVLQQLRSDAITKTRSTE